MADRNVDVLLIGGGVASAMCATRLRSEGFEGSVLLVGREPDPPYERPPLSKEYLRGQASREDALIKGREWYDDNDVELLTKTNVIGLDLEQRTAKLQTKEEVGFDRALVATGAMVNILRLDGAQLEGIHYLRAFGNSDSIRDDAADAEHVVCVGGSFIAAECAASLTAQGTRCTMVMLEEQPFANAFGAEVGERLAGLLTGHGVELVTGAAVEAFVGPEGEDEGRVQAVRVDGREDIPADAVIVGSGVKPDVMLAKRAGLEIDDGIVCDARLRTSADKVWAAGDVCSYASAVHGGRRMRVEHFDLAMKQGEYVARSMLGDDEPFHEVPYFWSDLADWGSLEAVGPIGDYDEAVWRSEEGEDAFTVFYVAAGRLTGAVTLGRSEDLPAARSLIDSGADISQKLGTLGDSSAPLDGLDTVN